MDLVCEFFWTRCKEGDEDEGCISFLTLQQFVADLIQQHDAIVSDSEDLLQKLDRIEYQRNSENDPRPKFGGVFPNGKIFPRVADIYGKICVVGESPDGDPPTTFADDPVKSISSKLAFDDRKPKPDWELFICEVCERGNGSSGSPPRSPEKDGNQSPTKKAVTRSNLSTLGHILEYLARSKLQQEVFDTLNNVRKNPGRVSEYLKKTRIGKFKGKDLFPADSKRCIVTKEGEAVVKEAIEYLDTLQQNIDKGNVVPGEFVGDDVPTHNDLPLLYTYSWGQTAMDQLIWMPILGLSAEDHASDIGSFGCPSHTSTDGVTKLADRLQRYGRWRNKVGECLWYGQPSTVGGQQMVYDLIVDDGVASRGHRHGVFDPSYHFAGVQVQFHKTFGYCCCINFAHTYLPDASSVQQRLLDGPPKIVPSVNMKVETQWKTLGHCYGCGQDIYGGSLVEGGPKNPAKWHKDCFFCCMCQGSLVGMRYFLESKQLYCESCHTEKFAETCTGCGEKIKGTCMTAIGKRWHPDCFKCSKCDVILKGGKYQPDNSGGAVCSDCMMKEAKAAMRGGIVKPSGSSSSSRAPGSAGKVPGSSGFVGKSTGVSSSGRATSSVPFGGLPPIGKKHGAKAKPTPFAHHFEGSGMSEDAQSSIVGNRHMISGAKSKGKAKPKPTFAGAAVNVSAMGMGYADLDKL